MTHPSSCPKCGAALASFGVAAQGQVACLRCLTSVPCEGPAGPDGAGPVLAGKPVKIPVAAGFKPPRKLPRADVRPAEQSPAAAQAAASMVALLAGAALLFLGGGVVLGLFVFSAPSDAVVSSAQTPVVASPPAQVAKNDAVAPPTPAPAPDVFKVQPPPEPLQPKQSPAKADAEKPIVLAKAPASDASVPVPPEPPPPVPARPTPPVVVESTIKNSPAVDAKKVDHAILRGVGYLKATQLANGTWGHNHGVGHAALCGLALLESKMPANDPAVQKAAAYVRGNVLSLNQTYDLSLAILFLDRLGDPNDQRLIQVMALRLVAGQNTAGGWTYACPLLPVSEMNQLFSFLHVTRPVEFRDPLGGEKTLPAAVAKPGAAADPFKPGKPAEFLNPLTKDFPGVREPLAQPKTDPQNRPLPDGKDGEKRLVAPGPDGNKAGAKATTKPAPEKAPGAAPKLLPKTAAPAPKPVQPRPEMLPASLRHLPIAAKPGTLPTLQPGRDDNSNSQFAILALWVARRHNVPTERTLSLVSQRYRLSQNNDGGWGYHLSLRTSPSMNCVGLLGIGIGHGASPELALAVRNKTLLKNPQEDAALARGLLSLAGYLGTPAANPLALPMENLYFLWSVERVAMLFNLSDIGGKDWYGWGAQVLLTHQRADGSWLSGRFPGSSLPVDTSFALLFLTRSNLVRDLSHDLHLYMGIVNPDYSSQKNSAAQK